MTKRDKVESVIYNLEGHGLFKALKRYKAKKYLKLHFLNSVEVVCRIIDMDSDFAVSIVEKYIDRIDIEKLLLFILEKGDGKALERLSKLIPLSKYEDLIFDNLNKLKVEIIPLLFDLKVLTKEMVWRMSVITDELSGEALDLMKEKMEKV